MPRLLALIVRVALTVLFALMPLSFASAQEQMASECLAVAQRLPGVMYASFGKASAKSSVTITYVGHSTYQIETPADVVMGAVSLERYVP